MHFKNETKTEQDSGLKFTTFSWKSSFYSCLKHQV